MNQSAAAVIGVPICDEVTHLGPALDSLLAQDYDDFAVVVVDDSRSDAPGRIVTEYLRRHLRLHYERNRRHLGLTASWRRAFAVARRVHPELRYYAWGSDHDVWAKEWLSRLVDALCERHAPVLAYPLVGRIEGESTQPWRFQTRGQTSAARLGATLRRMVAGDMVYGLFRADALERCGVFRDVLMPDRLLMAELALEGEFVQVPEVLWHRRGPKQERYDGALQRERLFAGRGPLVSYLPWWLQHAVVLARAGRPAVAATYLAAAPSLALARRAYYGLGGRPSSAAKAAEGGTDSSTSHGSADRSSSTE